MLPMLWCGLIPYILYRIHAKSRGAKKKKSDVDILKNMPFFKKILQHRVFHNSVYLIIIRLLGYIFPMIVLPYLSMTLGVDKFGLLMMMFSICSVCMIITDFGFNLSGTYYISKNIQDKNKINQYIGSVFLIKFIICIISIILFILISVIFFDFFNKKTLYIIISICFVQSFQSFWFFQGIEKIALTTIYVTVSRVIYIILIFLFIDKTKNVNDVLICYFISQVFMILCSIILIYKEKYKIKIAPINKIFIFFKESFSFFISRAAVSCYTSINVLIIGTNCGPIQAGYYSSAEQLYLAGQGLLAPIAQAFYPYMIKTKKYGGLIQCTVITSFILFLFCIFIRNFSQEIIVFFFGNDFFNAAEILNILLITMIINYISVNFGYPLFSAINKVRIANLTVIFGSIVHLSVLGIVYLFYEINALNVAYILLFTETCVMCSRIILFFWYKNNHTLAISNEKQVN